MKYTKLERSNRAHLRLYHRAQNSIDVSSNDLDIIRAGEKCNYHESVIKKQKSLGRVLTKTERKKIWKNTF